MAIALGFGGSTSSQALVSKLDPHGEPGALPWPLLYKFALAHNLASASAAGRGQKVLKLSDRKKFNQICPTKSG